MKTEYSFTEEREVFRPTLPIALVNPKTGKLLITDGLIDTGADVTVFPMNFFDELGIDVKNISPSNSTIYCDWRSH